jgi:hypothetical protein
MLGIGGAAAVARFSMTCVKRVLPCPWPRSLSVSLRNMRDYELPIASPSTRSKARSAMVWLYGIVGERAMKVLRWKWQDGGECVRREQMKKAQSGCSGTYGEWKYI